ncbi:nicotinamide N-methyltransferase-like [Dendronephthya gigantea]|uniref:nicotinamide N-methyltransferase-like n=1 Tax=Dendronephthya gigantea TaxID=151771 RepID=UPI001069597F|nr:nicotinamide N-methyltransferase-like [Dendronephthya gigantea]
MANLRYPEEYHSYFDPKTYLEKFYTQFKEGDDSDLSAALPSLKLLHEFWSNFKSLSETEVGEFRYLEYGGGPSITNIAFASPKVNHIVFSEYTEANRQAVKSWIAGEPDAHDWMPLFEVISELEQEDKIPVESTEKEKQDTLLHRADELKKKIKSIVPCDVTKTPIVQLEHDDVDKPFDFVGTSLCLEACVTSEDHYKNTVAKLCNLLKPNGYLFMYGVLEQTYYFVGKEKFYTFTLNEKMVKEAMKEAGIKIENFTTIPVTLAEASICDCTATFFTYGRACKI